MRVAYLEPRAEAEGPQAAWVAEVVAALAKQVELVRFGAAGQPAEGLEDPLRLIPRRFDRVLGVFENCGDLAHGLPVLRRVGGIAALYGWRLERLAQAASPALGKPGWRGALAALRHGGLSDLRAWRQGEQERLCLNRGVVRWADGFLMGDRELAHRVQDERNAPTAVQFVPLRAEEASPGEAAERWLAALELLPIHRTGAKSLLKTAIEGADAAREARAASESTPSGP